MVRVADRAIVVSIVVIDGLIKQETPGSLIEPARTYLFPANWLTLPLSFGLLMSPWGGHSVFPNIYRDMRHPQKFGKAIKVTFSFSYALDAVTAVVGLLMFGDGVLDEITANILKTSGYPRALTVLLCVFIAIIPLTKIPLNGRPIIATVEVLAGLHHHAMADSDGLVGRSATFRGFMRIFIRVATILVFLVISILFPSFDSIMAFMGSALCFTICVMCVPPPPPFSSVHAFHAFHAFQTNSCSSSSRHSLPVAFYVKLFGKEISAQERLLCYVIMAVSTTLSFIGTVWAFFAQGPHRRRVNGSLSHFFFSLVTNT
ncbi:vacuolar amino acid transporter 1 [Verticillium alfalfae VaMs.102]|uniref:Vacuolar amino acid transporter 1 n=1 Tax=Verticillium alfalfae (strain VaMs.102 / ATCC MYA-4576 / FGSC 10136) TaxID=526221 RepID=C9SUS2_VERA1|nr:vacuolar amino acid transporter 1 [Verticillium alfalfae VaMs.102]EEY22537.1 vacuolar amino acid transporter 1 [Verticillium alfalfae VaMs.102]